MAVTLCMSSASHAANAGPTSSIDAIVPEPYTAFIAEASRRFNIPANWIRAVIHVESRGNAKAVSPKGAMGLMQIMPATWASLRARYHLGADPFDPHDNILGGAACLRELYDRYGAPGFLVAYNAGPRRLEEHLAGLRPLPQESARYLATLGRMLPELSADRSVAVANDAPDWRRAGLFSAASSSSSSTVIGPFSFAPSTIPAVVSFALVPQSTDLFVPLKLASQ
jgi:soluble lytic murein transglycosylase-like protein